MEREKKGISPAVRYPLFMVGLLILLVGELSAVSAHAGVDAEAAVAAVGYIFLVLSVALR